MADDGRDRYSERDCSRSEEWRRTECDPLLKTVKPIAHHPPGYRPRNQVGDENGPAELPHQQPHDVAGPRAQDLADADLLRPPFSSERSEAEEAKATDDHGKQ